MNPRILFFLIFFLSSAFSEAIVHVGNGGGAAENTLLQMSPVLRVWAKACNENTGLCGPASFSEKDIKALERKVFFAPAAKIRDVCTAETILIAHEDLYVNQDVPKSARDLAEVLVKNLLVCAGWSLGKLQEIKWDLLPQRKLVSSFSLSIFNGESSDVIAADMGAADMQSRLLKSLQCESYRVISADNNFLSVVCPEDGSRRLILVRKTGTDFEFVARMDSEDLF